MKGTKSKNFVRRWAWWFVLLVSFITYLVWSKVELASIDFSSFGVTELVFLLLVILLFLPLITELEFFGIKLKRRVEEVREELSKDVQSVSARVERFEYNANIHNQISPVFSNSFYQRAEDAYVDSYFAEHILKPDYSANQDNIDFAIWHELISSVIRRAYVVFRGYVDEPETNDMLDWLASRRFISLEFVKIAQIILKICCENQESDSATDDERAYVASYSGGIVSQLTRIAYRHCDELELSQI